MKKKSRSHVTHPYIWIITVISAGILLCLLIFTYRLLPQQQHLREARESIERLTANLQLLEQSPDSEAITKERLVELITQVPHSQQLSRFIVDMQQLEEQLDIEIANISFGSPKSYRTLNAANSGGNGNGNGNSNGGSYSIEHLLAESPSRLNQEPTIYEQSVSFNVSGTYEQLTKLMFELNRMPRIVAVNTWHLVPGAMSAYSEVIGDESNQQQNYHLQIACTIYYVEDLAERE